jgi:hypothetical protein
VKNTYNFFVEHLKRRVHSGENGLDVRIILKRILKNGVTMWAGFSWIKIGTRAVELRSW